MTSQLRCDNLIVKRKEIKKPAGSFQQAFLFLTCLFSKQTTYRKIYND